MTAQPNRKRQWAQGTNDASSSELLTRPRAPTSAEAGMSARPSSANEASRQRSPICAVNPNAMLGADPSVTSAPMLLRSVTLSRGSGGGLGGAETTVGSGGGGAGAAAAGTTGAGTTGARTTGADTTGAGAAAGGRATSGEALDGARRA